MEVFLMNLLCYAVESAKVYVLYVHIMGFKLIKNKYIWGVTLILAIVGTSISIFRLKEYSIFGVVVVLFVMTMVLCKGNILKKILMFFPLYSFICLIDIWFKSMQQIVIRVNNVSAFNALLIELIISTTTITILIIIGKMRVKYLGEDFPKRLVWYHAVVAGVVIIVSCIFMGYSQDLLEDSCSLFDRLLNLVFICVWVALVLIVFIFIYTTFEKERYKLSIMLNEKVIKSEQQYYKRMSEKNEKIRSFRHDYLNHIACIKMFANKEDHSSIVNYIEEMEKATNNFSENINTGNIIVDTILNDTMQKYNDKGISFEIFGMLPNDFKVSNMDITTIFSNAIINAVEATMKTEQSRKEVRVSIKTVDNKCVIEIVNPIEIPLDIADGILKSTKKDKKNHGFGINNIKNSLEKYNGIIEYERNGNFIYTRIII